MSEDLERRPYCFPNKISRILLTALQEIMGSNGINAVLNTARLQYLIGNYPPPNFEPGLTFEEVGELFEAAEGIYGVRGGRRLARQAGRACFKYGIEGFGGVVGFADFALRLLPVSLRVHIGLEVLAEIFNRYSDQHMILGEDSESYYVMVDRCGVCWGRRSDAPACAVIVGLVEESLYWVSRGRRFAVEEVACVASGNPVCTIRVDKS